MECESCGRDFEGFEDEGAVCDDCRMSDRDEPCATVIYGDDETDVRTIGNYHDDTEGDFTVKWVSTDAWRGYFEVESTEFARVHTDCILSHSADAVELKFFDDAVRRFCDERNIDYARVFTRTSNVFSGGYDFFVRKKHLRNIEELMPLVAELQKQKTLHRDEERFNLTALTGKSGDFDDKDKILAAFAKALSEEER